jgi:cellulose biosynthesis protein BcsQ
VSPVSSATAMENQDARQSSSQKELANDVALLYSWAKIENAPYRDFSRQRKGPPNPPVRSAEGAKNEETGWRGQSNGSQEAVPPSAALASPTPASATVDVCSPLLLAGLSPEKAMPAIHQPPPTQLMGTHDLFPQPFPAVAKAGMQAALREPEPPDKASPVLAVYSIAGGVGKTTLCANLGKTLCSLGEQLLLVDASGRGLLPLYFGATDLRTGPRKFVAPGVNAPFIQVIAADKVTAQWLDGEVKPVISASQRTIFDLGLPCESLLPTILGMCTVVLIPLLPDLNSIVTVSRIESWFKAQSMGSTTPAVFYLFNRFDEHNSNDQRARDFVSRQCGHRLLPITLRHSRELTETLHDGIQSADPAPGSELSHDYLELALWVRRVAPLSSAGLLPGRWSEQ